MPFSDFDFYLESEVELSDLESYIAKGLSNLYQNEDLGHESSGSYPAERFYHIQSFASDFRRYQRPYPEQHYAMQDEEEDYFSHY